ncbi:malectin domain-containing carbohydrate-binding protein [Ovoidimarina sediminis]|uniref:malectin domain-containing carbohydrate-binding protein n=1 Tax=Ovoidimarina sediminis TaxID=3079856 RepID=UPI00290AB336|nr:malectin domain-containing carbohydrate-binding protein [Rhodophyticola sp. MJ-SS7]MDU8945522.1 malectin domain-containing carbohydrate-binding protein [Rhodophyticola sp. MJ-SS7]
MVKDNFIFGMNLGGGAYTDSLGNFYQADTTSQGFTYTTSASISGTVDDTLYKSERWWQSTLTYEYAVAPGTYYLELNFAEIYFGDVDLREFDILVEGVLVQDNLDLFESVGGNEALVLGYYVDVQDGALTFQLSPEIQNPKISAFSIWSVVEDPAPDLAPPTATINVSGGLTELDPVTVVVTYEDDTALDTTSIALSDLNILGAGLYTIDSQTLTLSPDGKSATATYQITQSGGWTTDPVSFEVDAGAFSDTSSNLNVAVVESFVFTDPTTDGTSPTVSISVSGGAFGNEPVTVTVSYADETALQQSTVSLADLTISGPSSYSILSESLTFGTDDKSATATYSILQDGGWSLDPVTFSVAASAVEDTSGNGNAAVSVTEILGHPFSEITPVDSYTGSEVGAVQVLVTPSTGVQVSTYGSSAFQITNIGDKRVAAIYIDISNAVLADAVFDPEGLAGDSVARGVTYGSTGGTGALSYGGSDLLTPFYGTGGTTGYEGMMIAFDPASSNGFQTGETVLFGVDVDPNSIVGLPQNPTDINGSDPRLNGWDIGGVSGAELIGASVDILFTDGSVATAQLVSDGSQGGAFAFASEASPMLSTELTVNGTVEGAIGVLEPTNTVTIEGPAGETARVTMVIGFAQPFDYTAPDGSTISVFDRLVAVDDPFRANNALEVQTVDVVLTGGVQDITSLFDFTAPGGSLSFDGDDALPVAFTSVVLGVDGNPAGPVSAPIYLQPADTGGPTVTISVEQATSTIGSITVTVTYSDPDGLNLATLDLADFAAASSGGALDILWQRLDLSADAQSATATYAIMPSDDDWSGDVATLSVAAGVVQDSFGNANAAQTAGYTFTDPGGPKVGSLGEMTQLALQGVSLNNPTSIDVGPDGRLYISQQNGLIVALTVDRQIVVNEFGVTTETWTVTDREDIPLIQDMPNHNDVGEYQPGVTDRQVTGLLTTTDDSGNIVIYVSSSDPRIGGGGSGDDKDLDTNSCILSRLTQQPDGTWEKLDLVRGLPRSEENHATNGLELTKTADGEDVILLTVGGFTNAGAQSNNFAYTPEYYYSASVVAIDLASLEQMEADGEIKSYTPPGSTETHLYLFDLPTLDDITRDNDASGGDLAGDGSSTADVFGGNNGLNQAIFDPSGIVKVVYSGFRNHYDIAITPAGEVYTVDNGSNSGWGGLTVNASGEVVVDSNGDGIADNGPAVNLANNSGPSNADSLLRLDDNVWQPDSVMYYGGHPNLYQAYSSDAGFYFYADSTNPWGVAAGTPLDFVDGALVPTGAPVDLGPLIPNADQISGVDAFGNPLIDPRLAVQLGTGSRTEGLTDTPNGALWTFFSSTNGLDVYEAAGGLQGDLVTVSFNGKIYAIDIGPDGLVNAVESRSLTSSPLDVTTQGDLDPYPGVIFVAAYGADQIVILSPGAGVGVTPDPNDRDQDGIDDTIDPFSADPDNGLLDVVQPGEVMLWTFVNGVSFPNERDTLFDGTGGLFNGGDIGFTGIMTNRGGLPESLYVQDNIIFGGAPGVLQVKEVDTGDPTADSQRNGFQLGVSVGSGTTAFTVSSLIDNYLDDVSGVPAEEKLSQGIFIGAGDQNNFVSVSLVRLSDGRTGFEVVSQFAFDFIGETAPQIDFYEVSELASAGDNDTLELYLDVDVANALVTPRWTYTLSSVVSNGAGASVAFAGDALKALEGDLTLPDDSGGLVPVGLAVGVVSSRSGSSGSGPGATVAAISSGGDESFTATIDGVDVTFIPDTQATNVSLTGSSNTYSTDELIDFAGTTTLDELHTEERYANNGASWGYDIATGDGTFQVDLYFAEIWSGAFSNGARIFDVLVEGQVVANDLDIYANVGPNAHYSVTVSATVSDGILDIDFSSITENAKLSGLVVRELGGNQGSFAADWDYLQIEGFGTPPPDLTDPTVAITVSGGVVADDPVTVTVTYADETELLQSSVELTDLAIAGLGTYSILSETLEFSPDGKGATSTYTVLQDGGWTIDPVSFSVADAAISDTSGNTNVAASDTFVFVVPGSDVTDPTVGISVAGGTSQNDPLTVTVTYSDDTALDQSTVALSDMTITGAGTYSILSEEIVFSESNESATATYSILQDGGWTPDQVDFIVNADAIADTSGNTNGAASQSFIFDDPSGDVFVFALNAGGDEYVASDGTIYAADTYGAGNTYSTSTSIANTNDDLLYQTETWKSGGFVYDIPVENGIYTVRIHFAEIWQGAFSIGARVFDLYLEDQLVLNDLDIYAETGQNAAFVYETSVEVLDGSLTLWTDAEIQNPKISAFSIWEGDMLA